MGQVPEPGAKVKPFPDLLSVFGLCLMFGPLWLCFVGGALVIAAQSMERNDDVATPKPPSKP